MDLKIIGGVAEAASAAVALDRLGAQHSPALRGDVFLVGHERRAAIKREARASEVT